MLVPVDPGEWFMDVTLPIKTEPRAYANMHLATEYGRLTSRLV